MHKIKNDRQGTECTSEVYKPDLTTKGFGNSLLLRLTVPHCVESVQKWSFFWSVFSRIRTEYEDLQSKAFNLKVIYSLSISGYNSSPIGQSFNPSFVVVLRFLI